MRIWPLSVGWLTLQGVAARPMAVIGDRDGVFEVLEVDESAIGVDDDRPRNNRLDRLSIARYVAIGNSLKARVAALDS